MVRARSAAAVAANDRAVDEAYSPREESDGVLGHRQVRPCGFAVPDRRAICGCMTTPRDPKDGQGQAKVGPKQLLEASLRMRPDRILLQELRDGTAFFYLRKALLQN